MTVADSALDPGTNTTIGANLDDGLIRTQDLDSDSQGIPGFTIPGFPDNYSSAAHLLSLAPLRPIQGGVTTTVTPVGGPGNA